MKVGVRGIAVNEISFQACPERSWGCMAVAAELVVCYIHCAVRTAVVAVSVMGLRAGVLPALVVLVLLVVMVVRILLLVVVRFVHLLIRAALFCYDIYALVSVLAIKKVFRNIFGCKYQVLSLPGPMQAR